ncbi:MULTISPECIES: histidine phosphatase family protein [Thalassospira]|uniref:histidine phosphatase family protein n=1 Tax=Thalassospira TaxID=168934 RepID=UPI000DEDAA2B
MRRIVLVRHAQAEKNVQDRHGGSGSQLTEKGRTQAKTFASDLRDYFGKISRVLVIPKPQCLETASIICADINVEPEVTELLPPYNLGILDGLSRTEARERFPAHALAMDRWRRGLDEIQMLKIPNATEPSEFYKNGQHFLSYLEQEGEQCVFVGTRSTLVLMWNVLRGREPIVGGGYFERPWENLEWVEFTRNDICCPWTEQRTQRPPPEIS